MKLKVYIKEIYVNGVLKDFGPIWIDSDVNIENDNYKSDCIDKTNGKTRNPHAYTNFTITNGAMESKTCIEKPPGESFSTKPTSFV